MEIAQALNDVLSPKWRELRLEIVSFGVSSVKASEEDEQMIKDMQRSAAFMNPPVLLLTLWELRLRLCRMRPRIRPEPPWDSWA